MNINFKPYKILLASILFCYSVNGQNLQKKYEEAYKYYEKKDYSRVEEICSQILLAGSKSIKDLNDIWVNHTAAYLMYFIYQDSTYINFNLKISKDYFDISKEYMDLLLLKDSKLKLRLQPRIRVIDSIMVAFSQIKEVNISSLGDKNNLKVVPQRISSSSTSNLNAVLVIVEGQGKTKDLAVNSALRTAIEKTFGAFISSNSKIIDDNLIKDEIVSISNGNILNYEILSQIEKNENFTVTISANISLENIIVNANKFGSSFELTGGVYYQNILKEEFYKSQEVLVLENFFEQWRSVNLFDYQIRELEMQRYVAKTYGEFWMPRVSDYLGRTDWTYFRSDLDRYNMNDLFRSINDGTEKNDWSYFPQSYIGKELFQIGYEIMVSPNSNYYTFIKAYADLLHVLSIKDINNYKAKFGEPIILWDLVSNSLINSINARQRYFRPKSDDGYGHEIRNYELRDGQVAFRNPLTLEVFEKINTFVHAQNKCRNITISGIDKFAFPPAYSKPSKSDWFSVEEFPYPHDRATFYNMSYILLSFSKDEIANLNSKIQFAFLNEVIRF